MKSVRALLQFTTILPLGEPADFDAFAQRSWLYPFAGYVAGAVAAVPGLAAWYFGYTNSLVVAAFTLALVIFITGANHFDGLLDLGDGLMAHGSREKRVAARSDDGRRRACSRYDDRFDHLCRFCLSTSALDCRGSSVR